VWSALAGLALFAATEFAPGFYGTWYSILNSTGFALILPVLASLHVRHAPVRQSGAVLGTIAGTCLVVIGLTQAPETAPAMLAARAVWWWTIGKMWVETGVLSRVFGWITMLGAIVFPVVAAIAALGVRSDSSPDLALRLAFSAWLLAMSVFLWPRRPVA
jgi:hypothetical protein